MSTAPMTCHSTLLFQDVYSPQLVWSANRNRPVRFNATLRLTEDGNLILADADGTFVWSTNTAGKSVSGLNLTETGNLVLLDRNNEMVWQSFDLPTDTLVLQQKLVPGKKLISSVSASNWTHGLFSLSLTNYSVAAYNRIWKAIDKLPLVPGVLEIVGIGNTGVWKLVLSNKVDEDQDVQWVHRSIGD
ncbi:EP1-like glycoprotein 4 [Vitis vinifera]|uniref:EP1-like glycoprotein 4 n=1 Tax=Vitis vinifera TaxID=29760 RepID=UPI00053F4C20|nr:EP1-like glycoprotein 4 [Vitis vinifera]|eukprot:XP_010661456.1 PREDICTED: epidermis-specific secreted glycoprotein EP1-like [Vitis vinifera]